MNEWVILALNVCISESCIEIEIKLNFYFHTSLWCLKRFCEGLTKKNFTLSLINNCSLSNNLTNIGLWKVKYFFFKKIIFFALTVCLSGTINQWIQVISEIYDAKTNKIHCPGSCYTILFKWFHSTKYLGARFLEMWHLGWSFGFCNFKGTKLFQVLSK